MQTTVNVKSQLILGKDAQDTYIGRTLEEYALPFGNEYLMKKLGWDRSHSDAALKEYRRFLYLAFTANEEITPSQQVDEVWHLHILHTMDYDRFSEICGRKLHHNPGMPGGPLQKRYDDQYRKTLANYERAFGEEAPSNLWPKPDPLQQGIDLRGLAEEFLSLLKVGATPA